MIYLTTPYSDPNPAVRERRFEEACRATAALVRAGVCTYSPVAHSHPVARYGLPTHWEFWAQIDREHLARCDVLAVLTIPGWRESVGVQAEIRLAREFGLPVVFICPSDLDVEDYEPPTLNELLHGSKPHPRNGTQEIDHAPGG